MHEALLGDDLCGQAMIVSTSVQACQRDGPRAGPSPLRAAVQTRYRYAPISPMRSSGSSIPPMQPKRRHASRAERRHRLRTWRLSQ